MRSLHVAGSNSVAVTGRESICAILKLAASGKFPTAVASFKGNLDKPSAFPCAPVGLNLMLHKYPAYNNAQCCKQAAARDAIVCLGPSIVVSGLWSVTRVNSLA